MRVRSPLDHQRCRKRKSAEESPKELLRAAVALVKEG
jgi:hypothetical protein